ncbi:MAG: lamin tail domain-containing protein, partial [Planctomycetales bacterium]|nr:lamin tail domain-containing protein [Planctomycetales bacterium]
MQRRLPLRKRRCLHGAEPLEARVVLDSTVVFSELMYNPLGTGESLEWIELHNQMSVNVDLSNWRLDGGVEYTFEAGTVIPGGGYLVIAADPATLLQETGYASALGPYRGNLSNSGEQLRLLNHTDRLMNEVEYGDRDDWPAGPDGSGATLAKSRAQSASHVASNWTTSAQLGGTPGAANFLEAATVEQTTLLSIDQVWRYEQSGTDLGTTWRDPGFNDNSWASGAGLLYSESAALPAPKNTPLTLGERTYYFRTTFDFNDTVGDATLRLNHVVDDGAVFYLNGQEIARFNMPTGAVSAATFANVGVGDAAFTLTGGLNSGLLQSGTNTLAVEVHQVADTSSDVVFGTELLLERVLDDPTTMSTTVRISEVAGSAEPSFWIELENITPNAAALNDMSLVGTGATGGTFSLNGLVIPAHGLLSFDESQLGFRVDPGERVFLTTSTGLLDAIDARDVTRARAAQLNGRWQTPAVGTPGAANQFAFPSDIVINEIMYHARPTYATDAVISPQAVVEIDQTWRFDDTGTDRGTSWREPEYNDSTWNEGAGLF